MKAAASGLSLRDARHVALAAQGFGVAGPAHAGRRAIAAVVARLGCVQIDSVNVLVRSHYLPFFSRLGDYDVTVLDDLLYGKRRAFAEYWAHEASIVDFERWPLLRWRMERARTGSGMWRSVARVNAEQPALVERTLERIAAEGPLAASDFEGSRSQGSWWGWSDTKRALEFLFWSGRLTTRRRRPSFEREYDLVERVIPAEVRARETSEASAYRELLRVAARALGVATESDLRDYFRLDLGDARRALAELVEAKELAEVSVEGWRAPAYVVPPLRIPRRAPGRALLSPFDNLIWNRPRAARLFAFDFRLEIYTPAAKRIHGYYVLP
ncbi:MAG: YcaQ family DNA glycosylase, partial [Candidatus Eremiobacteraeota bacterium]|nr:YcaQ family DNA glycosylase [Candidatus Eremiobacteraeota bacterium]